MTIIRDSDGRPLYGAIELKDSLHLYWMIGLGLAIIIHLALIATYKLAGGSGTVDVPGQIIKHPPVIWLPPPPMNPGAPEPINVAESPVKNSVGTPVPVPEAVADPEKTLSPQNLFNQTGPADVGGEGGEEAPIEIPEPAPPPFRIVEEMPKIVRSVTPVYPEIALRAGLEGTVIVKFWVDKEGKPREVSVLQSNEDIFNDAAIAAAKQYVFTPAYMNSGPVSVWITIPFRFRIAEKK
jgi:protein TonB